MRKIPAIQTEVDLWQELQLLSTEIEDAVTIFHTYEELNRLAVQDSELLQRFNEDALFWNTHRYALQASLFMIMGRIFDPGAHTRSLRRLVDTVIAHPEFFGPEALARRKALHRAITPEMIQTLLKCAWIPRRSTDLEFLSDQLSLRLTRVTEIYIPIRHAIFAHRLLTNDEAAVELFGETNRAELGTILDFAHDLIDALQMFYLNGHRPELGTRSYQDYNERIRAAAERVYRRLIPSLPTPSQQESVE